MRYTIDTLSIDPGDLIVNETIFHNANGYIGVRSNFEEGYAPGVNSIRGSYINGFYDFAEMKQAEKLCGLIEEKQTMLNVADTQGIKLFIDDEEFGLWNGSVLEGSRTLDMDKGFTERRVLWRSPQGKEAEIVIRRVASFTRLSLFLIDYTVRAINFSGVLRFVSTHRGDTLNYSDPGDPRVAAESVRYLTPVRADIEGTSSFISSDTVRSGLRVCTGVAHVVAAGRSGDAAIRTRGHGAEAEITLAVEKGHTARLLKYSVFTDSLRYGNCEQHARLELWEALKEGPEQVYYAQEACLAKFWNEAFLEIEGDEKLNKAVKYNMYQLLQSAGKDPHGTIAAKGLSGEGYEGHYFWDTEMYIEPFFTLTVPEITKSFIAYRYATLDEARKNAHILGHRQGALFPWRTIMGRECSGYFPSG
ncbi:MAG: family 65 glycosyl hydrolase, partial [Treponema sp.]|nr:family 65 glycosyl hydrolase [Treponema sp.]